MRVLWAAAELGLEYEHIPFDWQDPALKTPEFLAISPMGEVPTIVDDGFALTESMAILLYLAKRYGRSGPEPLYPGDLAEEADVWRWALWAQAALEPWVMRDAQVAEIRANAGATVDRELARGLTALERHLSGSPWLAAQHFTVADMCVAAALSPSRAALLDFAPYPAARDWLTRCYARPAALATRARFG